MPVTLNFKTIKNSKFDYPFRIFISGSSQSGKTHFAHNLLSHSSVFQKTVKRVIYFHPDYLTHRPVNWHETLTVPITYQSGVPSLSDLCECEPDSCIVLDDLYEECINTPAIDYLFRVLSGKLNLSVMILSQRYFASGKYAMNIRNNCNFLVLMRNVDAKLNVRVGTLLSLKIPIQKAMEDTYEDNFYPYIFIDSSPRGQVTKYRCYIDIFSKSKIAFGQKGMKAYIVSEQDFLAHFDLLNNTTATIKNGVNKKKEIQRDNGEFEQNTGEKVKTNFVADKIKKRSRELRDKRRSRKNLH